MTRKQGSKQNRPSSKPTSKEGAEINTGDFTDISGEVNIAAGDIIKNIQTIYERALTPGETAEKDLQIEVDELASGIRGYLERLKQQVMDPAEPTPYKGLEAYLLSDAGIFFGRDQPVSDFLKAIKRGRLTILQAESGAGKTSLLQAGITPRLIVENHLAILLRPQFENPTSVIKRCFLGNLELTPKLAQTPLVDFLRRVKEILGESTSLYLILDQFEEFFSKHTLEDDRQAFIRDLAQCLNDVTLNVRWILSITSDAFGQLGKFEPHIRNPFSNVQSLYLFNRQEAAEVIARPAKRHNLSFEEGLLERLLDDLSQHQNSLIAPTQIQLVCIALYDDCPAEESVFTLAQYEHIGGAEGILGGYIANVLRRLPPGERGPAYRILEELVTSEKKRVLRGKNELEVSLENKGVSRDLAESTLDHLVNQRLLRKLDDHRDHIQYEIVHDYLLNEIELNQDLRQIKEAEELLAQGKRNWKKFGVLLNRDTLVIIGKQRKELQLTPEDICLLLMSLADTKMKSREWQPYLSLAMKNHFGQEVSNLLLPWTTYDNKKIRDNAYKVLWYFVQDCPGPARGRIILRNVTFRTPIFLSQAVLAAVTVFILYQAVWIFSRDRLERIGWQPVQSLETGCLSSAPAESPSITVDPSNPANLIAFGKSHPYICQSTDAGSSWMAISSGLSSADSLNSMAIYDRLVILITPEQILYRDDRNGTWETLSLPNPSGAEIKAVSIGGRDNVIFIGISPHEIFSIQASQPCWETIEKKRTVIETEKGTCWDQIDTSSLAGEINFLSTNEKYLVVNTSEGTWFSEIEEIDWKKQPGLDGPIPSFGLFMQTFWDDGVFIAVFPGKGVQRGELGNPIFSIENVWPFPSTNGDGIWDWPQDTRAIAVSRYVFFASTSDSLQRYPGWSIFDREWWRIMKEVRSAH